MLQKKVKRKSKHTHTFNNFFLKNCTIYEIMWENTVQLGRPQITIWYKAKYTHSEYILLIASPLQQ